MLLAWELKGPGALRESLSLGLDITIAGDNDFYSQRTQECSSTSLTYRTSANPIHTACAQESPCDFAFAIAAPALPAYGCAIA